MNIGELTKNNSLAQIALPKLPRKKPLPFYMKRKKQVVEQNIPKLVFSVPFPNPNGSGNLKGMILSDGSTTCTCGQCTPTVECEHIHPLIVEDLRSEERRDDVVEGIVEHRRDSSYLDNTVTALRSQAIPRGSVLRMTAQGRITSGQLVRLLPDGKVSAVTQGPAIGTALANAHEGKVEVRIDYVSALHPNPQVMMRDLEDEVLRAMQIGLPVPKLDFGIGIDYSKEITFTAKADMVPPKPMPRRKFRL